MTTTQSRLRRLALERVSALDDLLCERNGLLTVLDRVVALHGTARLIRADVGASSGFVAELETTDCAVVRWMSGTRTERMRNLVVPLGQGIGGKVLALGAAVRVNDYVTSRSITHHFDSQVRGEGIGAMLAVPIVDQLDGLPRTVAIAYAGMRDSATFGDLAVERMLGVADQAGTALRVAAVAEANKDDAVSAERRRIQNSLHDSVGAMLFTIGAQVRALHDALAENPALNSKLSALESDISAASLAFRESLLALADTTPELALPVEIAEHTRSFERRTDVPTRFVQLGPVSPLDTERTALLIAVVREGLLNVEKHAAAQSVIVSFGPTDGGIHVLVADDGSGEQTESGPGTGMGVRTLGERAARLGGNVSFVRDEDGGCTLRAWLPNIEPN